MDTSDAKVDTSKLLKVDTSDETKAIKHKEVADNKQGNKVTKVDTSNVKVDTSKSRKVDTSDENKKHRITKNALYSLIIEFCKNEYKSIDEISKEVHKDTKYLKNKVIPEMIEQEMLVRLFPSTLNHPNQKYQANNG